MMGSGAEGEERSIRAAEMALHNPLLGDISVKSAKGMLVNITGGADMTLFEVDKAARRSRRGLNESANIIFGKRSTLHGGPNTGVHRRHRHRGGDLVNLTRRADGRTYPPCSQC